MHFVKDLVVEFFEAFLLERKNCSWSFKARDVNQACTDLHFYLLEDVLESVKRIATQLEKFIGDDYNERFVGLTEPLIPKLRQGNKKVFYKAFKAVADELFSQRISWSHIVTFLVYNAELAHRAIELARREDNEEEADKMVSLLVECVCRYFQENLMQWIKQQGWRDIIKYEAAPTSQSPPQQKETNNSRAIKQYVGAAAFAAVIGGLFLLCSKLSVQ